MIKINGEKVELSKFPNGETLVDTELLNQVENGCRIDFKYEKDEDILYLMFVLGHLRHRNIHEKKIYIYYMPYSRMDRSQNGSCFTLQVVGNLMWNITFTDDGFYVVEPHSDKTLDLLEYADRINVITPLMQKICSIENIDIICYPDKGAKARFQDDMVNKPIIYCEKIRDFDTGEIKGLELKSDIDLTNKNILILDDLCSKGGTFYYTAKKLKENGVSNVYLGVCHMEYSVWDGKILNYGNDEKLIDHIYCFDTMLNKQQKLVLTEKGSNMTIYNIEKFLDDGGIEE